MKRKKNEEYEEGQITTIYINVLNYILLENIIWKKAVFTNKFYLQFLCAAGYLKHSNDTPNLNIHKYTNYNIIETYINRLSTTMQIFIAMDYLITMSEKYLYFRKIKKHLARTFFTQLEWFRTYQSWSFSSICEFLSFTVVCTNKKIETMKPWVQLFVGEPYF